MSSVRREAPFSRRHPATTEHGSRNGSREAEEQIPTPNLAITENPYVKEQPWREVAAESLACLFDDHPSAVLMTVTTALCCWLTFNSLQAGWAPVHVV